MENQYGTLIVLPIYSRLTSIKQSTIFESTLLNNTKVVVATNIGEISITIDCIRYVVDSGFGMILQFYIDTLKAVPISKASMSSESFIKC